MEPLLHQNLRLKQIMSKCEQQIFQLKKIGDQNQMQIDSLLKFNQRLLSIIENQMPNKMSLSRKSSGGNINVLQPIQQTNEKELFQSNTINLVKTSNSQRRSQNHININLNIVDENDNEKIKNNLNNNYQNINKQEVDRLFNNNNEADQELFDNTNTENSGSLDNSQNIYAYNNQQNQQNNKFNQNINNIKGSRSYSNKYHYSRHQTGQQYLNILQKEKQKEKQRKRQKQIQKQKQKQRQKSDNSSNQNTIIFRQQKQSLIQMPKLLNFKLNKGLNQHYNKQLFYSIDDPRGLKKSRKTSSQNNGDVIAENNITGFKKIFKTGNKNNDMISEILTERVFLSPDQVYQEYQQVHKLLHQYKDDYNPQQYLHICQIIKNDLQKDVKQLSILKLDNDNLLSDKQRQLDSLRFALTEGRIQGVKGSGIRKITQIMGKLNINNKVRKIIKDKIDKNQNQI